MNGKILMLTNWCDMPKGYEAFEALRQFRLNGVDIFSYIKVQLYFEGVTVVHGDLGLQRLLVRFPPV